MKGMLAAGKACLSILRPAMAEPSAATPKLVLVRIKPAHKRKVTQRKSKTTWTGWGVVSHGGRIGGSSFL